MGERGPRPFLLANPLELAEELFLLGVPQRFDLYFHSVYANDVQMLLRVVVQFRRFSRLQVTRGDRRCSYDPTDFPLL